MNSSFSPAAPAHELTTLVVRPVSLDYAVEAWALPDFDAPEPELPPDSLTDPASAQESARLAQIRQEAVQAGFAQGQREGAQAGFSAGRTEGLAAAQAEITEIQRRLLGWLQHLATPLADLDREVGTQLARLATQMARALIYRELTLKPEQIDLVARAALSALPVAVRAVTLICHPDEVEVLQSAIADGGLGMRGGGEIHVRGEVAIAPGGLRVESTTVGVQAEVDATLDARWAALCLRVLGELAPGPAEAIGNVPQDNVPQDTGSDAAAVPQALPVKRDVLSGDLSGRVEPKK
ncbi:MAG: FliH/SctL family protein [Halothiobacillus sp.]